MCLANIYSGSTFELKLSFVIVADISKPLSTDLKDY